MADAAIVVKNLKKSYGKLNVLRGVSFEVSAGTILALLGPNGAGKTTTIKMLSTLIDIDGGKASICGHDVATNPNAARSVIGLTGQYAAVDEYLTGRENLVMMGRLYHLSRKDSHRRADELLAQFDLNEAASRSVKTYSGGMRRRLDLAASLIAVPPVIFLDEPTTGLDPRSRIAMWDIIKQLVAEGTTILLTTQYLEEADLLADNIVVIDHGKVIAEGTADQLKRKVGSERLELVVSASSDFEAAAKLLKSNSLKTDADTRTLSVANDGGVKKLKDVLVKMEGAGIKIEGLSLHKPTLDDVFLGLTGHSATTKKQDKEKK